MSKLYTERRHMQQRDKVNNRAENRKQAMRQQIRLRMRVGKGVVPVYP